MAKVFLRSKTEEEEEKESVLLKINTMKRFKKDNVFWYRKKTNGAGREQPRNRPVYAWLSKAQQR
jgi:hypothetical protein